MGYDLRALRGVCLIVFALLSLSTGGVAFQSARPDITIAPTSVDFGDQVAGAASKPHRVTLTNTGGADLYINSIALVGDNASDFVLSGDTCTGKTIPPGKSCIIDIVMTPSATGRRTAVAMITSSVAGGTRKVGLMGNGINSSDVPPR
jgi:hypothetical protein